MDKNELEKYEAPLMKALSRRVGREKAIGADALYVKVFGEEAESKISGTRKLRRLITELRKQGVPIASVTDNQTGGYFLASAGSELEEYLERLRNRGLTSLKLEARIRKVSLAELLGQVQLNLRGEAQGNDVGV